MEEESSSFVIKSVIDMVNSKPIEHQRFKDILKESLERANTPEGVPKELDEEFDRALDELVK